MVTDSAAASLQIANPGLYSILVDAGRQGMQQQGFCQSGAMDEVAFDWANWLCGNPQNTPVIESMGPLQLDLPAGASVAVTGPGASLFINGEELPLWQTLQMVKPVQLKLIPHRMGSRHYVALSARWHLTAVAGGVSTVKREGLGGLHGDGSALKSGDSIPLSLTTCQSRILPEPIRPDYNLNRPLDAVPGYQYDWFSPLAKALFFSEDYQLSPQIDRMGIRLQGKPVACERSAMRSEGINLGAIQVPADGQPIIMMKDRQTLGGYPKLGCVALYDIPRLAQAVPGDKVQFNPVDANNARARWLLAEQQFHLYRKGN